MLTLDRSNLASLAPRPVRPFICHAPPGNPTPSTGTFSSLNILDPFNSGTVATGTSGYVSAGNNSASCTGYAFVLRMAAPPALTGASGLWLFLPGVTVFSSGWFSGGGGTGLLNTVFEVDADSIWNNFDPATICYNNTGFTLGAAAVWGLDAFLAAWGTTGDELLLDAASSGGLAFYFSLATGFSGTLYGFRVAARHQGVEFAKDGYASFPQVLTSARVLRDTS